jgi:sialate O-acetylesterase
MVLQREQPVPVWGHAAPGEAVAVRFAGQEKRVRADAAGHWQVTLDALATSATPATLTVAGANTIELKNILVGEVWLCSGQSNMEYAFGTTKPWAAAATATDPELAADLQTATHATIRLFRVEKKLAPPEVVSDGWQVAGGEARNQFSAVGYWFGRQLARELGVPVGMIQSAWGGSLIEEWTPPEAYATLAAVFTGAAEISFEKNAQVVGRNYAAMIRPLAPFALRGVLWYQGESQIIAYHDGLRYADKTRVWIESWRTAWGRSDLPFYAVQIAPFLYTSRKDKLVHTPENLPELWEAQAATLAIPQTGLVPTTDLVGDLRDIHPAKKRIVAERLLALALAQTYGRTGLAHAGPEFERLEIRGAEAVVHFRHAADGLLTRDGHAPVCFDLAGADGRWFFAAAEIRGSTVVLTHPQVPAPVAVRFAWHETAQPNLVNRAGWPAYSFRSNAPVWSGANPATTAKTPLVP